MLRAGAFRPGRVHDATAVRTEGIEDLLRHYPDVPAEVDSGYQGLARDFPGQVSAPAQQTRQNALLTKPPSGNGNATSSPQPGSAPGTRSPNPSSGGPLRRWTGRRDYFKETALAIAGLVCGRAATW